MRVLVNITLLLCLIFGSHTALGQPASESTNPLRQSPPLQINTGFQYQQWSADEYEIFQLTNPISIKVNLLPGFVMNLGLSRAFAEKEEFESISGFSDLHLAFAYIQPFNNGNQLVYSLSTALPTGASKFTDAQYQTTALLALSQYNFNLPFFSQGFRIAPGITFITSITKSIVFSAGASYRYRGEYEPITDLANKYKWGNELILSLGVGAQLSSTLFFSLDGNVTNYDADRIGDAPVYENGNLIYISTILHKRLKKGELISGGATYYSIAENRIPLGNSFIPETIQAYPGMLRLIASYAFRPLPSIHLTFKADASSYQEDAVFESLTIYGISLAPTLSFGNKVNIPIIGKYFFGDLDGISAGLGLVVTF